MADIRKNTLENLDNSARVYLISSRGRDGRFDFPLLMDQMMKSLPDIKKEVIMRIIKSDNRSILHQKRKMLEKKVKERIICCSCRA